MDMKRLTACLVLSLVVLGESRATESVTDEDRFRLWNNCQPMDLYVPPLPKDGERLGLTQDQIVVAVRARIRAARLYDSSAPEYLAVNVNVVGEAFDIFVGYEKVVFDPATGDANLAVTWMVEGLGVHGGDVGFIMSSLAKYLDSFLDEYLRVNEDACTPIR